MSIPRGKELRIGDERICFPHSRGLYHLEGEFHGGNHQESDPEFGVMQSKEVTMTLQEVLAPFPVSVVNGKGYVEVCLKDVNKGATATRLLDIVSGEGNPFDFVFSAGDDSTDELMFAALKAKLGKDSPQLITATIGRKASEAGAYLDTSNEVVDLLEMLSEKVGDAVSPISPMKKKNKPLGFHGNSSSHFDLASLA